MCAVDSAVDVSIYGLANAWYHPDIMARPHRHNDVELNFIERGAITYLFGGAHVSVNAGQMAFFWATIPHQVILVEEQTIQHWITIPFPTFLRWQLPAVLLRPLICGQFVIGSQEESHWRENQALFRRWHEDLQQNTAEHGKIVLLEIEAHLRRLALSMALRQGGLAQQGESFTSELASEPGNVEGMACFIAEHYMERLSVEKVAQTVHLHPNYAMSLFHKHFGLSIVDYITQYRVSHAQRLLITTDANVSQIALDAGFGSVSRFYTAFKKVCGQSPVAYRTSLHKIEGLRYEGPSKRVLC